MSRIIRNYTNNITNYDILFREECYAIVGAAMKVHRALGHGFSESVYHEALIREFERSAIPFETKKRFDVFYEGIKLDKYFVADLVCFDQIVVELKATSVLVHANKVQVLNYLKASNMRLGILINFGTPSLTYQRLIL